MLKIIPPLDAVRKLNAHCVKSVQLRSFFWFVFSCSRTEYRKIWTRKTLYLDTFQAVALKTFKKRPLRLLNVLCTIQEGWYLSVNTDVTNLKYIGNFPKYSHQNYLWPKFACQYEGIHTQREKCPNTEFFLVRIFLYSDWIRRFNT